MTDDKDRTRDAAREWVRATTGILSAFKEAIEETIDDLRERGEVGPDRAKEAVRSTMRRAQQAVDDTKDRLDFVPRRELDDLRTEVAELRSRVAALEGRKAAGEIPVEGE